MDLPEKKLQELMHDNNERAKWITVNNHNITTFREADIKRITKNYTESIGKGGFGEVYKGALDDGTLVAVKKYKDQSLQQVFAKEVIVHCQINNKNVVRLLGYCAEENALTMVTEFIAGGNLEQLLHGRDNKHLSLHARLCIAIECAEALSCMHDMYQPIIHGDIKPANILLDANFGAKLSDFGISRLLSMGTSQYTMNVIGSRGYVDPEFLLKGLVDPKNDVYSFGVVLLELITRKKAWENGTTTNLTEDFMQAIQKGKRAREMFDTQVTNVGNMKILHKIGKLAADCLNGVLKERPVMKHVLQRLYMIRKTDDQQGQENTGGWSLWGTKRTNQKSIITSSSLIKWMGKNSIADKYYYSNEGPILLDRVNSIQIFQIKELMPMLCASNMVASTSDVTSYKGHFEGQIVTVKQLISLDGYRRCQFANEIIIQSRLNNRNILRLFGCCLEVDRPLLVYEFVSKGSLHDILHGSTRKPLNLDIRLNIAAEVAEALAYMHSICSTAILHGDLKPANILLDDNFAAKISDFGVSMLITGDMAQRTNYVSDMAKKSDVFRFGVVLLELITRKKDTYILEFLHAHNKGQKETTAFFDVEILETGNMEILDSLARLVVGCLNLDEDQRPEMMEVAERLLMLKRMPLKFRGVGVRSSWSWSS